MKSTLRYALLVLLAGACYGLISPILKIAYAHGFSAAEATDAQYLIGTAGLWLLVPMGHRLTGVRLLRRARARQSRSAAGMRSPTGSNPASVGGRTQSQPTRPRGWRQWSLLTLIGLAGAGTSYTYYNALRYLPASLAIVLLFQFTWMVVVMDILVTRRWPGLQRTVGTAVIVLGTFLAVGVFGQSLHGFPAWTLLFGLLAALCYALTLYLSAFVDPATSPYIRSASMVSIGTAAILCAFPPVFLFQRALWHVHTALELLLWGFLMALLSQILPPILMMVAIPKTGGRMAGVLGSIELPVAVVSAWLILGEHVAPLRWLGVALILAGIVCSEWPRSGRRPPQSRDEGPNVAAPAGAGPGTGGS
ncbi:MAG: EamA family transporter [Alicyclobacillus sp.]|nr:EamA family transporter [Alicyclobacillus sp.]